MNDDNRSDYALAILILSLMIIGLLLLIYKGVSGAINEMGIGTGFATAMYGIVVRSNI